MSDTLTLAGTLKVVKDTQVISDKFCKREFVIETDDKYPQEVQFELTQDNCDSIDQYSIGQSITVNFNVRGREYQGRWFVNLQAWKLEGQAQDMAAASTTTDDDQEIPF